MISLSCRIKIPSFFSCSIPQLLPLSLLSFSLMCSEIHQFSISSFLRRMSGNPHIFPVERKDEKEGIVISETPVSLPESVERERENLEDEGDHQPEEIKINEDETDKEATVSHKESEDKEEEEEEDGYETPTSADHRIPAITQCPPPPMKPRPPPSRLKRKLSPPSRSIQLDSSIFFANDEDDVVQQKIKRARTDDKDRS